MDIKNNIKFELMANKYVWKYAQFYIDDFKPLLKDYYLKFLNNFAKKKNVEQITSFEDITLQISTITTCNSKCIFCPYPTFKEKGMIMKMETFKKIINQFIFFRGKEVDLTPLLGEALLDNGLFEKIKYAKSKNLYVSIYTNGILLIKNDNYKKLVDSNIDKVSLSVGDIDPKIDSEIYGINVQDSKNRWKGIKKLINYAKDNNKNTIMHICFRSKRAPYEIINDPLFEDIIKIMGRNYENVEFALKYDNWGGLIKKENLLGIMRIKKSFKNFFAPCKNLYKSLSIFPDGSVRLCGCRIKNSIYDELLIGNMNNKTLKEIILSKKVTGIQKSFLDNNPPKICRNCSLYDPKI
jgi:radical SAM protein with 4Fe4S-binding SPASM domain